LGGLWLVLELCIFDCFQKLANILDKTAFLEKIHSDKIVAHQISYKFALWKFSRKCHFIGEKWVSRNRIKTVRKFLCSLQKQSFALLDHFVEFRRDWSEAKLWFQKYLTSFKNW
jgi:hypothetical protein